MSWRKWVTTAVWRVRGRYFLLIRFRNSSRVFAAERMAPSIQLVVVVAPVFCTPRMTMQKWLDDDGDTLRLKHFGEGKGDLLREAFLDLETAGEHFGDAGELRETNDAAIGDVADVHLHLSVSMAMAGGSSWVLPFQ
jgi:hypothetical protein